MSTILVPLDGSEAAEAVLPHLITLSFGYRTTVRLVLAPGAAPPRTLGGPAGASGDGASARPGDGAAYLASVAQWLRSRGVTTSCAEPAAPSAAALRTMVEQIGVDLLALATRGWSRLGATPQGAVAEQAVRVAGCPIVLLRVDAGPAPRPDATGARPYRRVVVALDGSPGAELALARVEPLARAFAAELLLVHATLPPPADPTHPAPIGQRTTGTRSPPDDQAETARYLAETVDRLRRQGVRAEPFTRVGPADAVILDCARTRGADLIAMLAGERAGPVGPLTIGRIADAVVRHAPCPVLVVTPP